MRTGRSQSDHGVLPPGRYPVRVLWRGGSPRLSPAERHRRQDQPRLLREGGRRRARRATDAGCRPPVSPPCLLSHRRRLRVLQARYLRPPSPLRPRCPRKARPICGRGSTISTRPSTSSTSSPIRSGSCARFRHPADREVVAFCAAALAFGRVQSVLNSIEALVGGDGRAPGGVRAALRARGARRSALSAGASLDPRRGPGRAAVAAPSNDRTRRVARRLLRGGHRCGRRDRGGRAGVVLDTGARPRPYARRTEGCRRGPAWPISSRGLRQAAPASGSICSCAGWCASTAWIWDSGLASGRLNSSCPSTLT